ncbi:hypothetical protein [Haloferula sargassicola]|uniref:Uncharacterized protein n=1 Tax=Haloferula sargassicola TaxID=490096 RepID=A0ABP9USJ4_9BACT
MKAILLTLFAIASIARAEVDIDIGSFGESLGGWAENTVSYSLSGANYRTYKPEISPTPDGGIFVSVRIDHRRGWLANDDHAVLEITFHKDGTVANARSTLAVQGRTISSDLIRSTATAGAEVSGVGGAVKIGTDLVADLSSKLLREKIVEAGRVAFPSAVQHNYNLLYQAVRIREEKPPVEGGAGDTGSPEPVTKKPEPEKDAKPVEIKPYGSEKK